MLSNAPDSMSGDGCFMVCYRILQTLTLLVIRLAPLAHLQSALSLCNRIHRPHDN